MSEEFLLIKKEKKTLLKGFVSLMSLQINTSICQLAISNAVIYSHLHMFSEIL